MRWRSLSPGIKLSRLSQRTHQREVERGRVLRETGQLLGRGAVEPGTRYRNVCQRAPVT